MTLDKEFTHIRAEIITTEILGIPRISEAPFENPDGSHLRISHDMFGALRNKIPTVGPIEGMGTGRVKIKLR